MEAAVKLAKEGKDVSLVDMTEIGKGTNPGLFGPKGLQIRLVYFLIAQHFHASFL